MGPSQWSYPRYVALRQSVTAFEDLAGYGSRTMTLTELGDPAVVSVEVASPSLFPILGVTAQRGRVFGADEEDKGAPVLTALVSDGFWRTRMGGAPDAVGRVLTLDRLRFQVVGVVSAGYDGVAGNAEVWIPFSALRAVEGPSSIEDAWNQHFYVMGRLDPDATLERARSEVAAFGATVMERFPPPPAAEKLVSGGDIIPVREARGNAAATTSMFALFAAVILVLLIATANLAGLLLARGSSRQREAAVRSSLGAGRIRLVRQLLTESLTLALIGGALGVGLAFIGVDVLGRWLAESLGTSGGRGLEFVDPASFAIDWRVYLFALVLTAGVGLAFGLLPAWQTARANPGEWLRGGRSTIGAQRSRIGVSTRSVLMVGQVALAVVLLSAASLMMRTTINLQRVDLGFDSRRMLTAVYSLSPADEQAGIEPGVFHAGVVERMRALPGVTAASIGEVPMGGPTSRTIVAGSDGRPELIPTHHVWIRILRVADGHLATLGATLIEGRDIEAADDAGSDRVVVLGRSAAEYLFPNGSPLGRRIRLPWPGYGDPGAMVVGVVEDMRLDQPGAQPERLVILPMRQAPALEAGLLIRTAGEPAALIPAVRSAMAEFAPDIALNSMVPMDTRVSGTTVRPRVLTLLLGFFGAVALLLVAIGLYGIIAYAVTERTSELGLRAALGAGRVSLAALVLRQGLGITGVGVVVGVAGSVWATKLLEGIVFGTRTVDPIGLAGVSAVLACVAFLAAYLPARRGMRVEPVVALRSE